MATTRKKNNAYGVHAGGRNVQSRPSREINSNGSVYEKEQDKALLGNNYLLVLIAGVMIILGFVLISGSATGIDEYNPDIYSVRRIVVGPTICFLGFVLMAIAILIKPKRLGKKGSDVVAASKPEA